MVNYMKSEWYRITHTKDIYVTTGILAGLTLFINLMLYITDHKSENFRYGTVSFSLSLLISGMYVIVMAAMGLALALFAGNWKNGILKNAVAGGISREKIFLGKCVVGTVAAFFSMVVILAVYIGSAVLLLDNGVVDEAVGIALRGVGSTLLMAIASLILTIVLNSCLEREGSALLAWCTIMNLVPEICNLLGTKIVLFKRIAGWMPNNYLSDEVVANMSGWQCLWETPEGLAKCLISGVLGIVIFLISGIVLCRKKDV